MGTGRSLLAVLLFIIGLAGIAVGIVYLTMSAHAIPSFFPGYVATATKGKLPKHGYVALGLGVVLLIISLVVASTGRRRHNRY
jgi:multisubunit Na+/H+ antiporter MnhB subunit